MSYYINTTISISFDPYICLVLGTLLTVYPAAGLPRLTLQAGGKVFIVNGSPTSLDKDATACFTDLAAFADAILTEFN